MLFEALKYLIYFLFINTKLILILLTVITTQAMNHCCEKKKKELKLSKLLTASIFACNRSSRLKGGQERRGSHVVV